MGVRCVVDQDWVTAAETCECALAHLRLGDRARATALLAWTRRLREEATGHYWTGLALPDDVHFPADERTTYTGAAVVLCDVHELSYEEAAAAMQVAVGTVKSRLSRARAHLRDHLTARGELPGAARRPHREGLAAP